MFSLCNDFLKLLGLTLHEQLLLGQAVIVMSLNLNQMWSFIPVLSITVSMIYVCLYFLPFIKMLVISWNVHLDIIPKIFFGRNSQTEMQPIFFFFFLSSTWVGSELGNLESCITCFRIDGSHTDAVICQIALQWPGIVGLTAQIGIDSSYAWQKFFS